MPVSSGNRHRNGAGANDIQYDSAGEEMKDSEASLAAKKLLAFFSWTCPNCNYSYTENKMPSYLCFCGRYTEPAFNQLALPDSCP